MCQLYALSLRFQFHVGLLILHVGSLHIVVELLCLNGMCLFCLSGFHGCLLDALVALEERAEAVFHAYAHIPDVEVLINRWQFEEDRSIEVICGNESYLWQKIALGNLFFLFGNADGVTALLQEWGVQGSCRLPVSLALLTVGLIGDRGIGDNLNLLACLILLASFFLQVSLVHSEGIAKLMVQDAPVVSECRQTEFEAFHLEFVSGDVVLQRHAVRLLLLDVVDELAGQLDVLFIHLDTVVYLIEVEILTECDEANLLTGEFHAYFCLLLSEFGEFDACIDGSTGVNHLLSLEGEVVAEMWGFQTMNVAEVAVGNQRIADIAE